MEGKDILYEKIKGNVKGCGKVVGLVVFSFNFLLPYIPSRMIVIFCSLMYNTITFILIYCIFCVNFKNCSLKCCSLLAWKVVTTKW
jgi:hypothetical protein